MRRREREKCGRTKNVGGREGGREGGTYRPSSVMEKVAPDLPPVASNLPEDARDLMKASSSSPPPSSSNSVPPSPSFVEDGEEEGEGEEEEEEAAGEEGGVEASSPIARACRKKTVRRA